MSRLTLFEGLLRNLEGRIPKEQRRLYIPPEEALSMLKEKTGQDFSFDAKAWREWIREHCPGGFPPSEQDETSS